MTNPSPHHPFRPLAALGASAAVATGGMAALLTAFASPAGAVTTFTVDSAGDDVPVASHCTDGTPGNCTFRDAAAAAADGDIIDFAPGVSLITLTYSTVHLDAVTISGPGSSALMITSAEAPGCSLFTIGGSGDATVSGLTVTKCTVLVDNAGDSTLDDVTFDQSASTASGVLEVTNDGDATITRSHFLDNLAMGTGGALAIGNSGTATVADSVFEGNQTGGQGGGAIYVTGAVTDFSLVRSTITGNRADYGGGVYTLNSGDTAIVDSTLSDNEAASAGGAAWLSSRGSLTVTTSTIEGNTAVNAAGGLYLGSLLTDATITGSTIAGNTSGQAGGGLASFFDTPLLVANSTLTGNSTSGGGGALYAAAGMVRLEQVTIAANTAAVAGGGIAGQSATIALSGSIVSSNTSSGFVRVVASGDPDDITAGGTITSDHSLIGTLGTGTTLTDLGGTIRSDAPGLGDLADNGGPTWTMALLAGSPAIDAGPEPVATFPGDEYDQRGPGFARIVGGRVDIGAYEVQPPPEPVVPAFTG